MKYKKINRTAKCLMSCGILIGCLVGIAIPMINQANTSNENSISTVQTGQIIHNGQDQVVNSVDNIVVQDTNINTCSQAVVEDTGVQELYVWGKNTNGELGLGFDGTISTPKKFDMSVFGKFKTIDIKLGAINHSASFALVDTFDEGQKLYTWGSNVNGQLGLDSSTLSFNQPQLVTADKLGNYENIIEVIPDNFSDSLFVKTMKNGQHVIYGTGINANGQLGNGSKTKSIKFLNININAGNYTLIDDFIVNNGSCIAMIKQLSSGLPAMYVWGNNLQGQLGIGDFLNREVPTLHSNSIFASANLSNMEIKQSRDYMLVLNHATNQLYACGNNNYGQLGLNHINNMSAPTLVPAAAFGGNSKIEKINLESTDSSTSSIIVKKIDGQASIYVWGRNDFGQLGIGNFSASVQSPVEFSPIKIGADPTNFDAVKKIVFGFSSYALVEIDGKLQTYVWGYNSSGQLGNNTTTNIHTPTNLNLPTSLPVIDLVIQDGSTKVNVNNNNILETYVCGNNDNGKLGLGHTTIVKVLTPILPTRATQLTTIKAQHNETSTSVYDKLSLVSGIVLKNALAKYIDFATLPPNAIIQIVGYQSDYENGILNLEIKPDFVYQTFVVDPIAPIEPIKVSIEGFKKVKSISSSPVTPLAKIPEQYNADQLYSALVQADGKIDYNLLSNYLDLSAIPDDANINLTRIPNDDKYLLNFNFESDRKYVTEGRVKVEKYTTTISLKLTVFPLGLVIGLSVTGGVLLIMSIIGLVVWNSRKKAIQTFDEYLV